MNTKFLLTTALCASLSLPMMAGNSKAAKEEPQDPNEMVAYLFTYFNSNDPKDEQICYAISEDGFH